MAATIIGSAASHDTLSQATALVRQVCRIAGQRNLIEQTCASFREIGLQDAVRRHDSDAIFDWMVEAISYQGISDQVAAGYIAEHGIVQAWQVREDLTRHGRCPKLRSYWHFEGCGFRKGRRTCKEPAKLSRCALPRHDLRNGSLNQASYSLFLFMRDVAGDDLVGWIDRRLKEADKPAFSVRSQLLRDAVVGPLLHVHGISHKVLHMTLANLLLAGDPRRNRWQMAGAAMVAVDSLVHNWLWRTGLLHRLGNPHAYGPACYQPAGCEEIITLISQQIDARHFNAAFPRDFPRFVQKAIWSYCAAAGLDICNGNRIDDQRRCGNRDCDLFQNCSRRVLNN